MSTIGEMRQRLVSDIQENASDPMLKAVMKKENNRMSEILNDLIQDESKKIKIEPLTDQELELCNQFEDFVKSQREE